VSACAELALQQALIARLKADAAVTALLGGSGRISERPAQERLLPDLTFGRMESRPFGGTGGEGLEHRLTLTVTSDFGGTEEAKAICAAARASLHNAAPELDGWRLANLRVAFCDVFAGADARLTYGVIRLRAVTESLTLET
jgi:hypothetical protein